MNRLQVEREWRRCRGKSPEDWEACAYFLRTYWHIRHPAQGKILFDLRPAQEETLRLWLTERYTIVLKARQIGFTTLLAGLTFWETFFWDDHQDIILSRTEREAKSALRKVKYGMKFMPDWLRSRGPSLLQDTLTEMAFDNDSEIRSLPSKSDPARGESVWRVCVDEWAFLENPEDAWASIEPVADVGGRIIGLSTANGEGNFFHTFWVRARTGVSKFVPIFFPWSANTERNDDWYEEKKANLPDWQLAQEYPEDEEEAFIRSGNPVLDIDKVRALPVQEPIFEGHLQVLSRKNIQLLQTAKGPLRMWCRPVPGRSYVVGADVAEGLQHGDYSVAQVLDVESGEQVAVWHGHIDPDLFGELLYELGLFYNRAVLGVEVNNHGLTTCKTLQRLHYPNIYYRYTLGNRFEQKQRQVGWLTTAKTKPFAIDAMSKLIRQGELVIHDEHTVAELRTFVREPDGKMHGSPYDDRTMALAIGIQMFQHAHTAAVEENRDDYMTMAWFERITEEKQMRARQPALIGAHNVRR